MMRTRTFLWIVLAILCSASTYANDPNDMVTVNVDIQYYDEIYEDQNHRLYTGTGAAPDTGTYWNQAAGQYGRTFTNLLASDGITTTSVGLTWTSDGEYGHPSPPAPNRLLMDYGFANVNFQAIVITGLIPGNSYDLYLYGNETYEWGGQVYSRGTTFEFDGVEQWTIGWGGGEAFVEGETYVVFTGVVADQNGEISGTYGDGWNYNQFNGLQIQFSYPEILVVIESGGSTNVIEGGSSDSFTVALASQPSAEVTVTLIHDSQITIDVPVTKELVFDASNWSTPQTVTVTAVDNDTFDGPRISLINYVLSSLDSTFNAAVVPATKVYVEDNDSGLVFHGLPITVEEALGNDSNGYDTYTVTLTKQPTANVNVVITTDGQTIVDTDLGTSGLQNTLTFTVSGWNTPQTVYVWAVDDDISEGPHTSTITHTCSSTDANFNGHIGTVLANVVDNEPYCGDGVSHEFHPADINRDCYVNILDLAELAAAWLLCTDPAPAVSGCFLFP